MNATATKDLQLNYIDTSIQTRFRLDVGTVKDYEEAMRKGDKFPPVIVFSEMGSERYWLVDGHHRLEAAKLIGFETIACRMMSGDKEAALHFALSANANHGLRRTSKSPSLYYHEHTTNVDLREDEKLNVNVFWHMQTQSFQSTNLS